MDYSDVVDAIIEHVSALALQSHAGVFLIHGVHSHTLDQDQALRSVPLEPSGQEVRL